MTSSFRCLLLLAWLVGIHGASSNYFQSIIANYKCDYSADSCRIAWQMDGECDGTLDLYNCLNNDCWDCDEAQQLDWDCDACVDAGGYWCPTDGLCRSQAIPTEYWDDKTVFSTCLAASDWKQTCESSAGAVFTDPLYDAMKWSYDMINVESVWKQGITGSGVHVRVNDVGMDANHPEFAANFDFNNSCATFVSETDGPAYHGTGVASILAANANNGHCAVGISPDVTLSACTFREDFLEQELVNMLETQLDNVDISSNSWGPEGK